MAAIKMGNGTSSSAMALVRKERLAQNELTVATIRLAMPGVGMRKNHVNVRHLRWSILL
jgi:hypothetical protein